MRYGTRIPGTLKPVAVTASATKPNEIFHIELETEGIPDETAIIQQLLTLEEMPDLRVLYIETDTRASKVTVQFMDTGPGQISFGGLFSAIPAVALLVGVVIVGIVLWQLYTSNLSWLLVPLIVVGGLVVFSLVFAGPLTTSMRPAQIRTDTRVANDRLRDKIQEENSRLVSERTTIKTNLTNVKSAEEAALRARSRLEDEVNRTHTSSAEGREARMRISEELKTINENLENYRQSRTTYQRRLDEIARQQESLGKVY